MTSARFEPAIAVSTTVMFRVDVPEQPAGRPRSLQSDARVDGTCHGSDDGGGHAVFRRVYDNKTLDVSFSSPQQSSSPVRSDWRGARRL